MIRFPWSNFQWFQTPSDITPTHEIHIKTSPHGPSQNQANAAAFVLHPLPNGASTHSQEKWGWKLRHGQQCRFSLQVRLTLKYKSIVLHCREPNWTIYSYYKLARECLRFCIVILMTLFNIVIARQLQLTKVSTWIENWNQVSVVSAT